MAKIVLLIVFYWFYETHSILNLPGNNTSTVSQMRDLTKFLQKFKDFSLVFHFYTPTATYVNQVVQQINVLENNYSYACILMYNHDNFTQSIERPTVYKVLHIFFGINEYLCSLLAQPDKIKSSDVVMFVSQEDIRQSIVTHGENILKMAGKTLFLHSENSVVNIYKICYYCGQKSKRFYLIYTSRDANKKANDSDIFPSKFHDFNGHLFYFTFIPYFPVISCEGNKTNLHNKNVKLLSSTECTDIGGIEGILLKALSRKLNFTYVIYFMSPDAGWFDMVKLVHNKDVDIAIGGISMTVDRIPLVQFTKVFNFEDFNILYMFDLTFQEVFHNFMTPFSAGQVWGFYLTTFLVVSAALYLALKIEIGQIYSNTSFGDSLWVSKALTHNTTSLINRKWATDHFFC